MDVRRTILINNCLLIVSIKTIADYNDLTQITLREWVSVSRYSVGLFRRTDGKGYMLRFNWPRSAWD
jgi:hypothetical protein